MIEELELDLARKALAYAQQMGAQECRISLTKSVSDIIDTLNGEIDKVSHCLDRSLSLSLFVDGKFGSFSTNRLEEEDLKAFILKSIGLTRILAKDEARVLPDPKRCCKTAVIGDELGLYDRNYSSIDSDRRKALALEPVIKKKEYEGYSVISEEGEYSDSEFDAVTIDSAGLFCRHMETSFEYCTEITIEDKEGNKYSGYAWNASPAIRTLDTSAIADKALQKAAAQIGACEIESGKYNMVVDREVGAKLVSPVLNALGGYSLQQGNSFMVDSLGKQVFSSGVTIIDDPHRPGESGSRLFDSEGVATRTAPIIENGVVKQYFINSYIAKKMSIEPTIEDSTRAHVLPWPAPGLDRKAIMAKCDKGILVTGFNGGNCNSATGDFSYGIEGFYFENGEIVRPVSEMLITGNFIELWNNLIAAGEDYRIISSKLIPTLAFANVDFNG